MLCCNVPVFVCVCVHVLQLLAVELLNVLHRLLLTRDPPSVQLQVMAVVQETIRSAHEHLEQLRSSGSEFTLRVFKASRHMASRFIMRHHVSSCGIMFPYATSWCITCFRVSSCEPAVYHVSSCGITFRHVASRAVMSCSITCRHVAQYQISPSSHDMT